MIFWHSPGTVPASREIREKSEIKARSADASRQIPDDRIERADAG
jgi:hypothetical protein